MLNILKKHFYVVLFQLSSFQIVFLWIFLCNFVEYCKIQIIFKIRENHAVFTTSKKKEEVLNLSQYIFYVCYSITQRRPSRFRFFLFK